MALLKKKGLWPELVVLNCLINWAFLSVAFLGIIVMVMGECHHGGVGMVRWITVSGGTETRWYHSHNNKKVFKKIAEHLNTSGKF